MHATIPKGNMGYDQYTVTDIVAVELSFLLLLSFSTAKHKSMASPVLQISLKNSELKTTHNTYRDNLSRALFLTTFVKTAVYSL